MSSIYMNRKKFWNIVLYLAPIFVIVNIFVYQINYELLGEFSFEGSVLEEDLRRILACIPGGIGTLLLLRGCWKSYCGVHPDPSTERKYVELQAMYVAAKTSLRSSLSQSFEKLPIFPFSAPYDDAAEETYERINIRDSNSSSLEAIVNNALDKIRDELGEDDVYYMRGDLHEAVRNNNNSRALLIIEEVKQSGGELAIVAVVFSKRGRSVNVDIRNSAFPNTIHSKTPRRAVFAAQEHSHLFNNWPNYNVERYFLYFSPIGWTVRGDEFVPRFNQQTTAAAESLAGAVYGALKYNLEQ